MKSIFNPRSFCITTALLFASLLHGHTQNTPSIQVETLIKGSSSWDGTPLPHYPSGRPEITLLRITIPPHTALPLHKHPVINAGILLKGSLTVTTPDHQTKHLNAGDTLIELVEQWHFGRNDGEEPAVILVFYAGDTGGAITIPAPKD